MSNIKKFILCMTIPLILILASCDATEQYDEVVHADLAMIDTVSIDHGSTRLLLEVADTGNSSLQAVLASSGRGTGIIADRSKGHIKIRLKSGNLFNLGSNPKLRIVLPASYTGNVIVSGSSGSISGHNLQSHSLHIKGKSGSIRLNYAKLDNHLSASTHSGNIRIELQDQEPDASWLLETGSGRRSFAFPLKEENFGRRKIEGITGNGSVKVHLQTKSGNIAVE